MTGNAGNDRVGVLFVCHGNICRSPLAEGVFKHMLVERGLESGFWVDSAGTYAADGLQPHPLSVAVAQDRGISLASVARTIVPDDLQHFDHVVAMDRYNLADIRRLAHMLPRHGTATIRLLREIADPHAAGAELDVPDPISDGREAYETAYRLIAEGCGALIDELARG